MLFGRHIQATAHARARRLLPKAAFGSDWNFVTPIGFVTAQESERFSQAYTVHLQ